MGALRLYGRGWARVCDYSGTATRREFWWFTAINAVVFLSAECTAFVIISAWSIRYWGSSGLIGLVNFLLVGAVVTVVITAIVVAPWTSFLVRRVRDATGSNFAAFVVITIAFASLVAVPLALVAALYYLNSPGPIARVFLLLAALGILTVTVVSSLPTADVGILGRDCVVAGTRPESDQSEVNDPWAR